MNAKLDIKNSEINLSYMRYILRASKIKILHICSDGIDKTNQATKAENILKTRSKIEKLLLSAVYVDPDTSITKDWKFEKKFRNVLVSTAANILTYLRQGLLDLSKIDYIIFDMKKSTVMQSTSIQTILNDFYLPQKKVLVDDMPMIYFTFDNIDQ